MLPEPGGGWTAITDDVEAPEPRIRVGPWSRSAVRGLAVIVALAVAVAAYWAWTGRPRAVAMAPTVVAVGTPLPTPAATPAATPEPAPEPAALPAAAAPAPTASMAPVPPTGSAPAASAVPQVVVHVTGLVARPGLVRLPVGSRVADAVAEAGGVTRRRAADTVNLARILVDGEQVVVGVPGAPGTAASPSGTSAAAPAGNPLGSAASAVDLNSATASALEGLPGVGPVIAARIVEWRTANGAFRSVEELGEVSGIGDAILAQVRGLVRV